MTSKNESKPSDKSVNITHVYGLDKLGLMESVVVLGYFIPNIIGQLISSSPKGFWEDKYESLYNFFQGNEIYILSIGAVVVHLAAYWSIALVFTIVDLTEKPAFIYKHKIKDEKYHTATFAELVRLTKLCLFNQIFVSIPFSTAAYFILKWRGSSFDINEIPDLKTTMIQMFIHLYLYEVGFYYSHRILHMPIFYEHIHKRHHEWKSPVALTAFYFHPLEVLISVFGPLLFGVILTKCHAIVVLLWVYAGINLGLLEHIGYKFPLYPSPELHTLHHQTFTEFYGASEIFDIIHKTNTVKKNAIPPN